jgi:DNA-binding transcriptional ArsR family regulator
MPIQHQPDQVPNLLEQQAKIFKALGHPSRLSMAEALREGEKRVCELQEHVGADMSTISKHLTVLRNAGIVTSQKRGTNIYYSLALPCLDVFLQCTGSMIQSRVLLHMSLLPNKER